MLMRADNGGIDHHVFVVVIARQQLENALENPALGPSIEALVDDFPASEALRKIAPWDASSISEKHGIHEQPVKRWSADLAVDTQNSLDPITINPDYYFDIEKTGDLHRAINRQA
jgi:hypothetical protein